MASTRTERRRAARGKTFSRLPGSLKPFKRAIALHQRFIDALASLSQALPIDRQIALQALPQYVSRGHGGRHRPTQRIIGGAWSQDRSVPPHQRQKLDLQPLMAYADRITAKTKPDPRAV